MKSILVRIILISFLFILFNPNSTSAEIKTFTKEYNYQASEYDSKVSCRTLALEQVKRLLIEEVGVYIESMTEVKNWQLAKDEITTLASGIVSVEIISENWDGKTYRLKAMIKADPDDVAKHINVLKTNHQIVRDLETLRSKADRALQEVERLKKELELTKTKKGMAQYKNAIQELSAFEWLSKTNELKLKGDIRGAIDAITKAIELDDRNVYFYTQRSDMYLQLGNHKSAINDYDKIIGIDPNSCFYSRRGSIFTSMGYYHQAILDFSRAINNGLQEEQSGNPYENITCAVLQGPKRQTLLDGERPPAPSLEAKNPNTNNRIARYYAQRGYVHKMSNAPKKANNDFTKAIELDPENAAAYIGLGDISAKTIDFKHTISLYSKAIEIILKDYDRRDELLLDYGYQSIAEMLSIIYCKRALVM